jgi:uncharacterized protein (TIGR03083 family)
VSAERHLEGFDPWDALDAEAARIDRYLSGLGAERWQAPSRCEGWTVRDVLAHLTATEDYHRACLDGTVATRVGELVEQGATDVASFNAIGIAELADRSPAELLEQWRVANEATRRRFRERGDGRVDTSVGDYPSRLQSFHVALELAAHADDIDVPVPEGEQDRRRAWRVGASRFALAEGNPTLRMEAADGRTRVQGEGLDVDLDDDELIAAVAARLPPSSRLTDEERSRLSATP